MANTASDQSATPGKASVANSPQYRRVSLSATVAPDRAVLLFSPGPARRPISESFDKIPTYLFRLHGPSTVGTTTTSNVTSPACDRRLDKGDLFQLPPAEAAKGLYEHLRWFKSHEEKGECNLMSWSSSLLFVLQYGLYRQHQDEQGGRRTNLSQMHLLVIDTRQFPKGTFIQDLKAIKAFRGHNKDLKDFENLRLQASSGVYYFGEYLSQGRLDISGRCSQTSMQQLVNREHLYELCPMLRSSDRKQWAKAVVMIRSVFGGPEAAQVTDKKDVRIAIAMAQTCFGSKFTLPLAAMLLSLRPREPDGETILDGLCSMFSDQELKTLDLGSIQYDAESGRMAEMELFKGMMMALHSRVQQRADVVGTGEVAELADSLGNITLSAGY